MGTVEVSSDRLYGAQTARAVRNFGRPASGYCLGERPLLVQALIQIKKAAGRENVRMGLLEPRLGQHIGAACEDILHWTDYVKEFPVHILHGGGGTSANMNANEVVANLANEFAGGTAGSNRPVHPLDHVNLNQSTNDVYPSACRITVAVAAQGVLDGVDGCIRQFEVLERANRETPKLVRTCLQDAVRSDWGRFFGAQAQVLGRHRLRVAEASDALCSLNLGGGIAGEPNASPGGFGSGVVSELGRAFPDLKLRRARHLADAAQNSDDLLAYGLALDGLSRTLLKQSSDLRLLSSGPEKGFMELALPPCQPGSSAMPGKVNPVIPEFVMQSCFAAVGSVAACAMASGHAELDLNVWEGTFVHGLLDASDLLAVAMDRLGRLCLAGIRVDEEESRRKVDTSTAHMTAYARKHSYSAALKRLYEADSRARTAQNGLGGNDHG